MFNLNESKYREGATKVSMGAVAPTRLSIQHLCYVYYIYNISISIYNIGIPYTYTVYCLGINSQHYALFMLI